MNQSKEKINKIVEDYKLKFADEYEAFGKAMIDKREIQANEFAASDGAETIEQFAHEIPLSLYNMLLTGLDEEDKKFFESKDGALWFAKAHPDFSPALKV